MRPGFLTRTFAVRCAEAGLEVPRNIPTTVGYDLDEWLAHGGPSDADAREIIRLLESSRADLAAQRVDGRPRFRHRISIFVLRVPAR